MKGIAGGSNYGKAHFKALLKQFKNDLSSERPKATNLLAQFGSLRKDESKPELTASSNRPSEQA